MNLFDRMEQDSWEALRKKLSLCLTGLTGESYVIERISAEKSGRSFLPFLPWGTRTSAAAFTLDGETLYLPAPSVLGLNGQGFAALKIMGLFAWKWRHYTQGLSADSFPQLSVLSRDLFFLLKGVEIENELIKEYKGVESDLRSLRALSLAKRRSPNNLSPKERILEALIIYSLDHNFLPLEGGGTRWGWNLSPSPYPSLQGREITELYQQLLSSPWGIKDEVFLSILKIFENTPGRYRGLPPVYHRGGFIYQKSENHKPKLPAVAPENLASQKGAAVPGNGSIKAAKETKLENAPEEGNVSFIITRFVKLKFLESFLGFSRPAEELNGDSINKLNTVEEQTLAPSSTILSRALKSEAPVEEKIDPTPVIINGATPYPELDYRQQSYRRNWCRLREKVMRGADPAWMEAVERKHRGLFQKLRRQFEALRPRPETLKAQLQGDEVDLDAYVESYADIKAQSYYNEAVYQERRRKRREVAAAFLVDISASTAAPVKAGRIIDLEKEALAALTYALEILGDQYALFAFSGRTRNRCDFYPLKNFGEPFSLETKRRLASLEPQDYTRMGTAIRHSLKALEQVEAKTKILFILGDAKPNDFDYYEGPYGIEDTKKALFEASEKQIKPFGLVIADKENNDLPRIFGSRNYVIIKKVEDLPHKLPELYRSLTT